MKKLVILTSVLALTACGGGSGGGAGAPGQITNPADIPTGDKTFLANSDSGLSMIDINKTRSANYENAIAVTKSIESQYDTVPETPLARSATRRATRAAAKSDDKFADIDAAYQAMHDILVNAQLTGKSHHDILFALALCGLDEDEILALLGWNQDTGLTDALNKFTEILDDDNNNKPEELAKIIKNADSVYKDFGKNFDLDLSNAKFDSTSSGGYFTFVFEDGNLSSLKAIDTDGNESMGDEYKTVGNGRFEVKIKGTEYGFELNNVNGHPFNADITYANGETPSDGKVRDDLLATARRELQSDSIELKTITEWLKTAPIVEIGTCTNESGCIEIARVDYTDSITVESKGKELGLKYSDFGLKLDETEFHDDDQRYPGIIYREHTVFAGGYEDKKADAPQSDMTFTGLAYAGVTSKSNDWHDSSDYQEPDINMYNGTAKLTVTNNNGALNQKLVADFTKENWYKVTVDDMQSKDISNIHFDGTPKDNTYVLKDGVSELENMKLDYYGPDKSTPTEATGYVEYVVREQGVQQGSDDWIYKADISFGVKRD